MAQPKRKSPDRKSAAKTPVRRQGPSLALRLLQSTAAGIARYPRMIGGVAIFGVVFSFVAANALWYQPRHHPSPMLATRMFDTQKSKSAAKTSDLAVEPGVTVFRIERQQETARTPAKAEAKPAASPLIKAVQQALSARGLYDGPADGMTGPKTTAAILFFQETEGLDQTGEATPALLAKIKAGGRDSEIAVIPDERPSMDVTSSTRATPAKADSDDVADLIRAADADPKPAAKPIKADADGPSPAVIMQIQRALTKFAYADIKADGVVGEATRSAIRDFEKSYNMPVTGEPSERIVKKLKSIGAL